VPAVAVAVDDAVAVCVARAVGDTVGVSVRVAVGLAVTVRLGVGVRVGERSRLSLSLSLSLSFDDCLEVVRGVLVRVTVAVGVRDELLAMAEDALVPDLEVEIAGVTVRPAEVLVAG
jgi:hypothetical protein